jgi:small nuclear ribonucleoprotein (snRNP)-like protein
MSELIKDRIKKSIGKEVELWLYNGFRFLGKIVNCDNSSFEILDYKTNSYKIFKIRDLNEISIKNEIN